MSNMLNRNRRKVCGYGCCLYQQQDNHQYRMQETEAVRQEIEMELADSEEAHIEWLYDTRNDWDEYAEQVQSLNDWEEQRGRWSPTFNHIYDGGRCIFCNVNDLDESIYGPYLCVEREAYTFSTETGKRSADDWRFESSAW